MGFKANMTQAQLEAELERKQEQYENCTNVQERIELADDIQEILNRLGRDSVL